MNQSPHNCFIFADLFPSSKQNLSDNADFRKTFNHNLTLVILNRKIEIDYDREIESLLTFPITYF